MIYWRVMMMWMMLPRYLKKNIVVAVVVVAIVVVSLLPYRVDSSRRNCLHRHRQWRKMTTMTMVTGEVSVDDEAVVFSSSMNDTDQHVYYSQAMTMTMIRTLCSKNNRPPPPSTMALGE